MALHWFIHHAINNVRFWYGADELTEVKVRCERGADIGYMVYHLKVQEIVRPLQSDIINMNRE
ncbi:hypothetical protein B1209_14990 [Raoultella planticola]|uniref:Uncharacterized protein n=1 Tax=Raoultella planticola TaxID=575 RepID=A0A443VD19_RAOPL|nr:hypothetical protein B1209_14990 [Raoultella planticola]KAJ93450.1 hypothetical protein DF41_18500 [Raoultella planticola]MBZ7833553.1 hypothetical protein [Raoultella planticola]PIM81146.1 hypothetical protein CT151_28415 [Raoultella planticola]RNN93450.1 hypothetical protein BL127_00019410 [Raoultella planticola]